MPPARILVVDDEQALLALMDIYLGRMGYAMQACASPNQALKLFESDPEAFDLSIVDLTMPEISGEELALKFVKLNPKLRVLLCTGYPYDVKALPAPVRNNFDVLLKPFVPKMLDKAVGDLLRRNIPNQPA
ncbi:MAG TPA: response regulator [Bryobacteraceae bacterium]|nr:response regulator [Bryobacteraceae bacterium]